MKRKRRITEFDFTKVSENKQERGLYTDLIENKERTRHYSDMSSIESSYIEALVNDIIMEKGVNFTMHSLKKLKKRHILKGRACIVVRNGSIQEIGFTRDGVVVLFSYASGQQLMKGYLTYVAYNLSTGNVVTAYNRQGYQENKKTQMVKKGYSRTASPRIIMKENCLPLLHKCLNIETNESDVVSLIRKYGFYGDLDIKSQQRLEKFRLGETLLKHL